MPVKPKRTQIGTKSYLVSTQEATWFVALVLQELVGKHEGAEMRVKHAEVDENEHGQQELTIEWETWRKT